MVQTERVLENIKAVLVACGSSFDQVLKCTVYVKDMADFPKVNEVYARYFRRIRRREPPWKWPGCRATLRSRSTPLPSPAAPHGEGVHSPRGVRPDRRVERGAPPRSLEYIPVTGHVSVRICRDIGFVSFSTQDPARACGAPAMLHARNGIIR